MPDGSKTYKTKSGVYTIPDKEYSSFVKDFPDAKEVQSFTMGKDTFDIPIQEIGDFLKENPNAQSLKKKVGGDLPTNGASPSLLQSPSDAGSRPQMQDAPITIESLRALKEPTPKQQPITMAGGMGMGTTSTQPIEDKFAAATDKANSDEFERNIASKSNDLGVKPEHLKSVLEDLPNVNDENSLKDLADLKETNPNRYVRQKGALVWQQGLFDAVNSKEGNRAAHDVINQIAQAQSSPNKNYEQARGDYKNNVELIRKYVDNPDEQKKLISHLNDDAAINYSGLINGTDEAIANDPRSKFLDKNEVLGLHWLEDTDPAHANFKNVTVDPSSLDKVPYVDANGKESSYTVDRGERLGMQTQKAKLASAGIELRVKSDQENIDRLTHKAQTEGLSQEENNELNLHTNDLAKAHQDLDELHDPNSPKYGLAAQYEIKNIAQELGGQKHGLFATEGLKALKEGASGVNSIVNSLRSVFNSDENDKRMQLSILGQGAKDESETYVRQKNQPMQSFEVKMSPDLQKQIDAINSDKSLSEDEKLQNRIDVLSKNHDWYKAPIDGKFNLKGYGLLYGVGDAVNSIGSFVLNDAVLGGMGNVSKAKKALTTLGTVMLTDYNRNVESNLKNNVEKPYEKAAITSAITGAAFALGDRVGAIKDALKGKGAAGDLVNKMSDEEVLAIANKTPSRIGNISRGFGSQLMEAGKSTAQLAGTGTAAQIANDAFNGEMQRPEDYFKQAVVQAATFAPITMLGLAGRIKDVSEVQRHSWYEMASKPEQFMKAADDALANGTLSEGQAQQIKSNIETVAGIHNKLPYIDAKGEPLNDDAKAKLLLTKVKEVNLKEQSKQDNPPSVQEKIDKELVKTSTEANFIYDPKTTEQLTKQQEKIEAQLAEKNDNGESVLTDDKRLQAQGELAAIKEEIKNQSDAKSNNEVLPTDNTSRPEGSSEITQQRNEAIQEKPTNETASETVQQPEGESLADDKSGIKNDISNALRAQRDLPKVEIPKIGNDSQVIGEGKELVDGGKINPREVVNRVNDGKGGFTRDESKAMQYYMRQLASEENSLQKSVAESEDKGNKEDAAILRERLLQLNDEVEAATSANMLAGREWSDIGNIRQIMIDSGFNPHREKAVIKDIYGGEIPKEAQLRIDEAIKQRDEAINKQLQLEEKLKNKDAELSLKKIKDDIAFDERKSSRKLSKEELKEEAERLLEELKKSIKKDTGNINSGIPIPVETINAIGKLAINYFKQGVTDLEGLVDKIYMSIKDLGYNRGQIRDAISKYPDLRNMARQSEIDKLQKKENTINSKLESGNVLPKLITKKLNFEKDNEWVKVNRKVAEAEFKLKRERLRAQRSTQSKGQKLLAWASRWSRRFVLSGIGVINKLGVASVVGGVANRIPESLIGELWSHVFSGVANKAPIEGFSNAKSEAAFYKEFFNPKKFLHNSKEIVKSGASDLTKKYGKNDNEHFAGWDIFTDLHAIIKDPLKRAAYENAKEKGIVWAAKNGLDIHDPLVMASIEQSAYQRGEYEIFQEQNDISKAFNNWIAKNQKEGNWGATKAFIARFLIPINTVPINIARRLGLSITGLPRGLYNVRQAYIKGLENLSQEQAEIIMRQLKKGSVGFALWATGVFLYKNNFGGLFNKDDRDKQREDNAMTNEMLIGGVNINKAAQHALPFQIIQAGATFGRVLHKYLNDDETQTFDAYVKAAMATTGAVVEQIPIVETPIHLAGALSDPYQRKKLKEDIGRRLTPQIYKDASKLISPPDE